MIRTGTLHVRLASRRPNEVLNVAQMSMAEPRERLIWSRALSRKLLLFLVFSGLSMEICMPEAWPKDGLHNVYIVGPYHE
jgi:hypothetical protein